MRINHNTTALNAYSKLNKNNSKLQKQLEKLSSGYCINRAGDDAAGLAISEKMRAQINGLEVSQRNAYDGISLIQTAEGALDEVHSMLDRMITLATQSANGVYGDGDRNKLQSETAHLLKEIDRISESTKFNGKVLFDGSYAKNTAPMNNAPLIDSSVLPKDGTNIVFIEITDEFATGQTWYGDVVPAGYDINDYKTLIDTLETQVVPQAVSSLLKIFPDAFSYLKDSSIGIGLKLDMTQGSQTLASVTAGISGYMPNPDSMTYTLTINVPALNLNNNNLTPEARDELENTVAHEMMHAMMDEATTAGMFGYNGGYGFNDAHSFPGWFKEGLSQSVSGACYDGNDWIRYGIGITDSTSKDQITTILNGTNKLGSGTGTSEYGTGYLACMYLGYVAGGKTGVDAATISKGIDSILKDLRDGDSLDDVIKKYTGYADTATFEQQFAGAAGDFVGQLVNAVGNGAGGLVSGNLADGALGSGDLLDDTSVPGLNLFKLNTSGSTVQNKYPSDYKVINGGSKDLDGTPVGSNYTNPTGGGGTNPPGGGGGTNPPGGGGGTNPPGGGGGTNPPGGGGTTPTPAKGGIKLKIGPGAGADESITVYMGDMSSKALGLDGMTVATIDEASKSISKVYSAIDLVSSERASLGAVQNRLEHVINCIGVSIENLQASESRIRDTDMAKEMSGFLASQILTQAAQSMLAQANQLPQNVVMNLLN